MSFRTILVPVEQHDLMNSTLETALRLAQKFDSYVEGFALRGAIPAAYAMADAAAVAIPELEQDIAENAKQTRGLFETFMQEHGVPRAAHTAALSSKWLYLWLIRSPDRAHARYILRCRLRLWQTTDCCRRRNSFLLRYRSHRPAAAREAVVGAASINPGSASRKSAIIRRRVPNFRGHR